MARRKAPRNLAPPGSPRAIAYAGLVSGARTTSADPHYHPAFEGTPKGTHLWFDSVEEYAKHAIEKSAGYAGDVYGQVSRVTGRDSTWDFQVGWDGALKLAREGWPEGAAKVEALLDRIEQHIRRLLPTQRNVMRPAMVGGRVSVPAYLAGHPKQFLVLKREAATCKTVTMVVSSGISCDVSADTVMRRGVAIAAAVRALEQRRVRVELISMKVNKDGGGFQTCSACTVKRAQDKLQSDLVAFALAHPAFPRRIGFAFQEAVSLATNTPVPTGYGMSSNFELPGAYLVPTKPCFTDEEMEAFSMEIINTLIAR